MAQDQKTKLTEAVDRLLSRSLGQTGYQQEFVKADPALKKLAEQRRQQSAELSKARSGMRTNPELQGLDPAQREALIANREAGIGQNLSRFADMERQQYGTATQRAGIAYEGQQMQYQQLQDMLNRVKEEEAAAEEQRRYEQQLAMSMAGRSGGGGGGCSGGSGSGEATFNQDMIAALRALESGQMKPEEYKEYFRTYYPDKFGTAEKQLSYMGRDGYWVAPRLGSDLQPLADPGGDGISQDFYYKGVPIHRSEYDKNRNKEDASSIFGLAY